MKKMFILLFATLLLAACGSNDSSNQNQANEHNNNNGEEATEETKTSQQAENKEEENTDSNTNTEEPAESNSEDNQAVSSNNESTSESEQHDQSSEEGATDANKSEENSEKNMSLTEDQVTQMKSKLQNKVNGPNGKGYADFNFYVDDFDYDKGTTTITAKIAIDGGTLPSKEEARKYTEEIAAYTGSKIIDADFKTVISSVLKKEGQDDTYLVIATHANGETAYNDREGLKELD